MLSAWKFYASSQSVQLERLPLWKLVGIAGVGLCLHSPLSFAQRCSDTIQASTPDTRFSLNSDGTVTDKQTSLIWKRCLEGQSGADCSSGSATSFQWPKALEQAASQAGWRVPNIKEVSSIVELSCYDPAINLNIFPNQPSASVWSNSFTAGSRTNIWYVDFQDGDDAFGSYLNDYDSYTYAQVSHLRLVRDAQ